MKTGCLLIALLIIFVNTRKLNHPLHVQRFLKPTREAGR